MRFHWRLGVVLAVLWSGTCSAGVGDPQVRTDHPWYPGELAFSTFDRLFETQAALYERVTGTRPDTEEQKALASWLWRNTHYFHAEDGAQDLWGKGFGKGGDSRNREYWNGFFAYGFGLCGTTHSQWTAEMEALFGHGRGRGVGVAGHNSFEVFLRGGAYGDGRWALLDHDLSTVIFDVEGQRLLSIAEVTKDYKRLTDRSYLREKQQGWPVCGLHPGDGGVFESCHVAEYLAGYAGPPPMVHLRRGETLRRYLKPGLEDGKTFVFWGRNDKRGGIPGPERSLTWVNQPDTLFGGTGGVASQTGQARFGNAVFTYRPDFSSKDYQEGIVSEDEHHVVFEFRTPYVIAATPASDQPWGIYDEGCTNGLVVTGSVKCPVAVSTDAGRTWQEAGELKERLDLTDLVKGGQQYWLRVGAGAKALAGSGLTIVSVCQANAATMPRLSDEGSQIVFERSDKAVASAGPEIEHARTHVIEGSFGTPRVTLELATPREEPALEVYAAAHVASGNPPDPNVNYGIEYSTDGGRSWLPIVEDWSVTPYGENPADYWSQSLCYGRVVLDRQTAGPFQIRFRNDGGKNYLRAEAHLVYRTAKSDAAVVRFAWTDHSGSHQSEQVLSDKKGAQEWTIPTQQNVETRWVEFAAAPQ